MSDTSEAAAELQVDIQRRLGGPARLTLAFHMSLAARGLALSRLRTRYPDRPERELWRELLRLTSTPSAPRQGLG